MTTNEPPTIKAKNQLLVFKVIAVEVIFNGGGPILEIVVHIVVVFTDLKKKVCLLKTQNKTKLGLLKSYLNCHYG